MHSPRIKNLLSFVVHFSARLPTPSASSNLRVQLGRPRLAPKPVVKIVAFCCRARELQLNLSRRYLGRREISAVQVCTQKTGGSHTRLSHQINEVSDTKERRPEHGCTQTARSCWKECYRITEDEQELSQHHRPM